MILSMMSSVLLQLKDDIYHGVVRGNAAIKMTFSMMSSVAIKL